MKINLFYILGLLIIIIYILFNYQIDKIEQNKLESESCYGYLNIDKIHLRKCLYELDDEYNTLDLGLEVYYLNPLVILGHSGTYRNCYLNRLNELEINDIIEIGYPNTNQYRVVNIYRKNKDELLKLNSDVIIVSCDTKLKDKQIVVEAKKISI